MLNNDDSVIDVLEVTAKGFENSKRKTIIIKVRKAYGLYKKMIRFYGIMQLIKWLQLQNIQNIAGLKSKVPAAKRNEWLNVGGQLIPVSDVELIKQQIKNSSIQSWDALHKVYQDYGNKYAEQKLHHALASLLEIDGVIEITHQQLQQWFDEVIEIKSWIIDEVYNSRAKDYTNPFRKLAYETQEEMNNVLGALDDNSFIKQQGDDLETFKQEVKRLQQAFSKNE